MAIPLFSLKSLIITICILLGLGLMAYIAMAIQSHKRPATLGLYHGQLRPCPASPNCVCSETTDRNDPEHGVPPIQLPIKLPITQHGKAWDRLTHAIDDLGGVIDQDDGHYLHATFTSSLFRFVDDVELRQDTAAGVIQIRSASRAGRSDFGINRQRVQRIRAAL